jgi:glycosyltransferase involved in cell wall biosynthesis
MKLRICLPVIGNRFWLGGVSYVENLVKSLHYLSEEERPFTYLFLDDIAMEALDLHRHFLPMFDGFLYRGEHGKEVAIALDRKVETISTFDELYSKIDFFFLPPDFALDSYCSAAWIPDFQHKHLPHFFHSNELNSRDESFRFKAEHARMMVLSSSDAEHDFRTMFPNSTSRTRILSFHTLPEDSWLEGDPKSIQQNYQLPDSFLICCNQFWIHKNHLLLFEALALLKNRGIIIPLVCTGSTHDYRCQGYFDEICKLLKQNGLSEQIHILGNIQRADQIQLIRRSMAVVQPSLFEGWSTVVEDARALGKTQILSDLNVHKEQAPDFAVYFDRNDPTSLADTIQKLHPLLVPGPNPFREQTARSAALRLVKEYGQTFCSIAREACSIYHALRSSSNE